MKKLILFILTALMFVACSKDQDAIDCGAVITQTPRSDGGVQESVKAVACGDAWRSLQENSLPSELLFKKGVPRSTALYLVSIKTDTVYIRYVPGPIPRKTIDSFKNIGYAVRVSTITGLEHIKWP